MQCKKLDVGSNAVQPCTPPHFSTTCKPLLYEIKNRGSGKVTPKMQFNLFNHDRDANAKKESMTSEQMKSI